MSVDRNSEQVRDACTCTDYSVCNPCAMWERLQRRYEEGLQRIEEASHEPQ